MAPTQDTTQDRDPRLVERTRALLDAVGVGSQEDLLRTAAMRRDSPRPILTGDAKRLWSLKHVALTTDVDRLEDIVYTAFESIQGPSISHHYVRIQPTRPQGRDTEFDVDIAHEPLRNRFDSEYEMNEYEYVPTKAPSRGHFDSEYGMDKQRREHEPTKDPSRDREGSLTDAPRPRWEHVRLPIIPREDPDAKKSSPDGPGFEPMM